MKILGFDLGDGESAVALLDANSTVEPRMLPIHGRASVLSAVGTKEGRIVVGEEASVLSGAKELTNIRPYPVRVECKEGTIEGRFLFGAVRK